MQAAGLPVLNSWQNFTMIIGTAAATLTGLMFIAITLIASIDVHVPTVNAGLSAFNTPTLVHFCSVLLLALILNMPWQAFTSVRLALGLLGLLELVYLVSVVWRMRLVPGYQPPFRDWLWYGALPISAYVVLIAAAAALPANPGLMLYFIAAVMITLLFIGIRNAWDLVTYLAIDRAHPGTTSEDEA